MTTEQIERLGATSENAFFLIGAAILAIEVVKGLFSKEFRGRGHLDMIAGVSTQLPTILVETVVLSFAYVGYVALADAFVTWTFPITVWTVVLAVFACDFIYYWEHRIAHEVRVFWTQHAVHHSSRYMNTSVAVRFGPFEGVVSAIFHLPLVLIGFPPALVFFGIIFVLAYQTWIHTELIGKLGVFDAFLNTPSNHRVHHACDDKYIDKNYGGILIIWDRLFGTYQAEEERPTYGLKRAFDSVNPLVVWFSETPQFFRDLRNAGSVAEARRAIFGKPGSVPDGAGDRAGRANA